MTSRSQLPLIACSLEAAGQQDRLDDWAELLGEASRAETADGVRYVFAAGAVDVERIRELVVAEQSCCSFLQFDVARVVLELR